MADEETTETAAVETTEDTTDSPEEAQNTQGPIPYTRFAEVNTKRREAEGQLQTMTTQVEELRREVEAAKEAAEASKAPAAEAPTTLSANEKIAWYVEQAIKSKTGMSLADMKATLSTIPTISNRVTENYWSDLCKSASLDPASTEVRAMVSGLVRETKATPEAAVKQIAALMKPSTTKSSPSSAETTGISSTTVVAGAEAWTADEAVKLAREGKAVPHKDLTEILAEGSKRRAKR